jgi:hypothetical protein
MESIEEMIASVRPLAEPSELDTPTLQRAIQACLECLAVCSTCADACAGDDNVVELRRCIRLNLDCADVCGATARILSRRGQAADLSALRALLEACASSCSSCAAECHKHADDHAHCGVCAAACQTCARACQDVLETLFEGPSA